LQAPLRIWQEGSNFTPAFLCAAQPDLVAGDKVTLRVSGSNDVLQLVPQSDTSPTTSMVGQTVVVEGTIPETVKGKTPDTFRYRSMTAEKSK